MTATIDMTYSFLRDDEPSDEQLLFLMREVAEEACRRQEEMARQVIDNIKSAYVRALATQGIQQH